MALHYFNDFERVWLYVYDLTEIKDEWGKFQKLASRVMFGDAPHLSIVVYGREFEVEAKGPSCRFLDLVNSI